VVLIAQCACPRGHVILAVAFEETEPGEELLRVVADALVHQAEVSQAEAEPGAHRLDPWCSSCGAPREAWVYESSPTRYGSMADAAPELQALRWATAGPGARLSIN
jgi:hypothetical protein